jgi:hypothetical protein
MIPTQTRAKCARCLNPLSFNSHERLDDQITCFGGMVCAASLINGIQSTYSIIVGSFWIRQLFHLA